MKTVSYSKEEKIRLLRANGYVVREEKVANFSKDFFAFKAEKKYNIDSVFDSTVKSILLMMNPGGGGEEEEEEGGFYTAGLGIGITGAVISLSHLGFEDLTNPGSDKILVWDSAVGSVGWGDLAVTSKVKVSSNDTTPGYLENKLVLSYYGGNVSEILELSTINEGANEIRVLQLDETKINHDNISGISANNHHNETHTLATTGPHTDSLPLIDLAPGTAGDIITRQATDWAVLAKGTENYVLKMGATYPAWGTVDWSELTGTQPAPVAHNHAWSDITSGVPTTFAGYGISDTLANLNTALSDATLYKWEADQGAVNIHGNNVIYGSAASTACVGNDARLSDSRTPIAHAMDSATYHTSSDITVLNATTSKHGFLRKLGGGSTNYLRADGTWVAPPGSGMVYPGAGIALSTGSAWGTSITNNSANWNTAYTHSQVAGGNSVHVSTTENTHWDTAYSHSQSNSQAHSDYMLNTGDTVSGSYTFNNCQILLTLDGQYYKLNIAASAGGARYYTEQIGTDATSYLRTKWFDKDGNTKIFFRSDGGDNYFLGNVGIGTASPTAGYKLNVVQAGGVARLVIETTGVGEYDTLLMWKNPDQVWYQYIDDSDSDKFKISDGDVRMTFDTAGNVGIGIMDPGYKLDVNGTGRFTGDVLSTDFVLSSDSFLKKNVVTVRNGLKIALSLRPVHFDWIDRRDEFDHIGFIAQDMEKVRPELVKYNEFKGISYSTITAINNAAIHVLNTKIETSEEKIIRLEKRVKELENERS